MNKTLLLAVTAAFALAACGQDSAPKSTSATPKSAPPAASAPSAAPSTSSTGASTAPAAAAPAAEEKKELQK
jgi:hypothetical protein